MLTKAMKSKLTISLVVLLVGSNLFWLYQFIDMSVTNSYQMDDISGTNIKLAQLSEISKYQLVGLTEEQAIQKLIDNGHVVDGYFVKDGCIHLDAVCLRLNEEGNIVSYE